MNFIVACSKYNKSNQLSKVQDYIRISWQMFMTILAKLNLGLNCHLHNRFNTKLVIYLAKLHTVPEIIRAYKYMRLRHIHKRYAVISR